MKLLHSEDWLLASLWGGFWGIFPDYDLVLTRLGLIRHRGEASHSIGSSMVLTIVVAVLFRWFAVPYVGRLAVILAFLGTILHTAMDSLTKEGAKLMWPFSSDIYRGPFRYDSLILNGFLLALVAGAGFLLFAMV